jgi:hypothetical protein
MKSQKNYFEISDNSTNLFHENCGIQPLTSKKKCRNYEIIIKCTDKRVTG